MRRDAPSQAPAFFVPFAETADTAEEGYASVKAFMLRVAFRPTERRIYRVDYRHNGRDYVSIVGEREPEGEPVIAIFEAFNPSPVYMICTPNRGVVTGGPILAGNVQSVTDFSPPRETT